MLSSHDLRNLKIAATKSKPDYDILLMGRGKLQLFKDEYSDFKTSINSVVKRTVVELLRGCKYGHTHIKFDFVVS